MKQIVFILLILTESLFSCIQKENSTGILKMKNKKGEVSLLSYIILSGDSILNGNSKFYWINGRLKDEVSYKNGLRDGWHLQYDSSGNLKRKVYYKDGLIDGNCLSYDQKGNLINEAYYMKNRQVFAKEFYQQSSSISVTKLYNVFGEGGNVQYVVLFDSTGKKFYENGFIFDTIVHFYPPIDSIKLNTPTQIKVLTTKIPGYSRSFKFFYFANNKEIKLNSHIIDSGFYLKVKFSPPPIKNGLIFLTGELRDEFDKVVKRDTLNRIINVISDKY